MSSLAKRVVYLFLLLAILIYFGIYFTVNVNYFDNDKDKHQIWLNQFQLTIVNNIRETGGLLKNKLGMPFSVRETETIYWIHHPPLLTITLYAFTYLLGDRSFYILPLAISLSLLSIIFTFISYNSNPLIGFWSAFLIGIHRIFTKYSLFLNYEPVNNLLNILIVAITVSSSVKREQKLLLVVLLILNMLFDWVGYFAAIFVFIYYFFVTKKGKKDQFALALLGLPFVMFALFFLHIYVVTGSFNDAHLVKTFLGRSLNTGEINEVGYNTGQWADYSTFWGMLVAYKNILFKHIPVPYLSSGILFLLFFLLLRGVLNQFINQKIIHFVLGLFFIGFSYTLVFNVTTFHHDFIMLFLIPPFVISFVMIIYLMMKMLHRVMTTGIVVAKN